MRELARVVRPGGRIAMLEFSVPDAASPARAWEAYVRVGPPLARPRVSPGWGEVGGFLGPSIRGFWERLPSERLVDAWREAGIDDVQGAPPQPRRRDRHLGHPWRLRPRARRSTPSRSGGWRDYVTLLHPPYTAWHLSYVAIGAALTRRRSPGRGSCRRSPRSSSPSGSARTRSTSSTGGRCRRGSRSGVLVALAAVSIAGAVAIGIVGAVTFDPWIGAFVAAGAFIVVAYNLESFGGRFHGDAWFALAWGAFPLLTAYFAAAESIGAAAIAGAVFAFALSLAQRVLSTQVRDVRRRVSRVEGTIERRDGTAEQLTPRADHGPGGASAPHALGRSRRARVARR